MFTQGPGNGITHSELRFARTKTRDMLREPAARSENVLALKRSRHYQNQAAINERGFYQLMSPIPCSAIVLAGGRATRLGGIDKALVNFAGRPLIAHVLERLTPQVDDILINCNRNQAALARLGYPLISDEKLDYSGPLAGIISSLPACRHETVLVVPCDSPFLPDDLHDRLSALLTADKDLVIAHDSERLQPLFMLLRRALLPSLRDYREHGHYKVERWCMTQKVAIARFAEPRHFINLNTPEELKKAESGA